MLQLDDQHCLELVQAISVPAAFVGADLRLLAVNDGLAKILDSSLVGRPLIMALRQPTVIDAIERALDTPTVATANVTKPGDNRESIFDVSARPLFGGVLATFMDHTAAKEAKQMRSDFVANVSHELRTPVTSISGFIETLQGPAKDDDEARARFLNIMQNETQRMTRLVDELMQLSRLEANERVRPTEEVNLAQVIDQSVQALAPIAATDDVEIRVHLQTETAKLRGDFGQLQQVLNNLIENAIKYAPTSKVVDVSLVGPHHDKRLRTDAYAVAVQDFGAGISPDHLARLTERFYRVDSHRSREVGGTGLGLAIVKHIVSRHRGRLKIESEEGKGSKFTVLLPV